MTGDYQQKQIFKIGSFVYLTELINMCILYLLCNLIFYFRIEQRESSTTDRNNSRQHVAHAD